ncbi:hypothetical protein RSP795_06525 [Ralstonia solanacearum]|nr:hypothetical protein RSP795_06525 [Ralstonia solanacearum]
MGTLYDQEPRDHRRVALDDLDSFLSAANELAKQHKISVADVIAAKAALEAARASDLYVRNGDVFDEQMMGVGQLLQDLSDAIGSLKEDA